MKNLSLTTKIFIGLVIGIFTGVFFNLVDMGNAFNSIVMDGVLDIIGTLFISSIQMLVVPLVFVSLVLGVASVTDMKQLGRVGSKTVGTYLITTTIAIIIALMLASITNPGVGLNMSAIETGETVVNEATSFKDVIIGFVPRNPVQAFVDADMLQIITMAILFGISMVMVGDKAKPVLTSFESFNEIILQLVTIIMSFAPYGVFALITTTFFNLGLSAIAPLIKYTLTLLLALLLHFLITYTGMIKFIAKLSPKIFIKKILPVMGVAFSTASSSATLPATMETAEEKFGVDNSVASFALPLGATINMDGTSIMQGVATIFISQVYDIPLGLTALATVVISATLASIGTAGVPGVGLITLSMVLTTVGLPPEGIALIMGIDRILDMARTAVNIAGDTACSIVVAKSEGLLDETIYNSMD